MLSGLCGQPSNQSVYNFAVSIKLSVFVCMHGQKNSSNVPFLLSQLQFRRNDTGIWWRNFPMNQECTQSATALQPDTVDNSTIQLECDPPLVLEKVAGSSTQYRISFSLRWEPPAHRYGGYRYEISIGDRHVDRDGINNPSRHYVVRLTHLICVYRTQ